MDANIGIVGGLGWLGTAIGSALSASGLVDPARLTLSGRSGAAAAEAVRGAHLTRDNQELVDRSDIVILSVRPDQFADVQISAGAKLVISVMAGVTAQTIASRTGATEIVRSIPSAAAAIRQSFTPWYAVPAVSEKNRRIAQTLFEALGSAEEVPLEWLIDYCAGMTGSGAAFPALLARAMIEHAVSQGLPAGFAERAATGVLAGAGQLLREPGVSPTRVVDEMLAYRGITAAGLQAMIDHGFIAAVGAGLGAAMHKASAHIRQAGTLET
jgi:pyrroline-5-carboxylate reductase